MTTTRHREGEPITFSQWALESGGQIDRLSVLLGQRGGGALVHIHAPHGPIRRSLSRPHRHGREFGTASIDASPRTCACLHLPPLGSQSCIILKTASGGNNQSGARLQIGFLEPTSRDRIDKSVRLVQRASRFLLAAYGTPPGRSRSASCSLAEWLTNGKIIARCKPLSESRLEIGPICLMSNYLHSL